MGLTEIKASKEINGEKREAAIAYDFGETLEDAVAKFGADVVFTNFKRTATITAQAAMRRELEGGKGEEEIVAKMAGWKPGVAMERVVDPVGTITARIQSGALSQEEIDRIVDAIKAKRKK